MLPAFGVTVEELQRLSGIGCTLVDTTCGSVLNVWKNVSRYARDGYTSVIHGKYWHEETRATASQATQATADTISSCSTSAEALVACDYIRRRRATPRGVPRAVRQGVVRRASTRIGISSARLREPDHHAEHRVAGDRRDVPAGDGRALRRAEPWPTLPRFDTICSATQDRQDAVVQLLAESRSI